MEKIRVAVAGCCGRMGQEVIKAVLKEEQLQLVAAVDRVGVGEDVGLVAHLKSTGVKIESELTESIHKSQPQVLVDFTSPQTVMINVKQALKLGVNVVVGTTGISQDDLKEIAELCTKYQANALVAPNFAIGALLMMRCAAMAAQYFPQVEIIELHHNQKLDAPSGTAIKTAEMILDAREVPFSPAVDDEEKIKGARGGELQGIHLHSVRLPGLIAHQEVIFGGEGQTLTIRHDSLSRESFMPGVILGVKQVSSRPGLTYGLDKLLW